MRLLAHIAAFAIIGIVGYFLMVDGYGHFLRQTHSSLAAQIMALGALGATTVVVIWATRKIP